MRLARPRGSWKDLQTSVKWYIATENHAEKTIMKKNALAQTALDSINMSYGVVICAERQRAKSSGRLYSLFCYMMVKHGH